MEFLKSNTKVRLYSYGGSGLKFLAKFLKKYMDATARRNNSHRRPCKEFKDSDKIIVIYGDPRNAILSFFRKRNKKGKQWLNKHLQHLGINQKLPSNINLETFLQDSNDMFDLNGFLNDWLNFNFNKKDFVLFIKYESLFDGIEKLFDFLDLDKSIKDDFIKDFQTQFKLRQSNYKNKGSKIQALFYDKYKTVIDLYLSLDDIFVR